MDVSVSLLPSENDTTSMPDVAVVIDVLRATSVMATALAANATRIVACAEIEQAKKWKERFDPNALLCGERQCQPIDGFDQGNSPAEYTSEKVDGRTLVMTTTNGTRAIVSVQRAKRVITASFLNLTAVVHAVRDADSVLLLCAGTDGKRTDEDILLAGAIAQACADTHHSASRGDGVSRAIGRWQAFQKSKHSLTDELRETAGGRNLVKYGFEDDLARCSAIDTLVCVPVQIASDPPVFAKMSK